MSRSHVPKEGEPSQAHVDLSQMMKRGRSWSGRERHCAYLNLGSKEDGQLRRFANVSAVSGIDFPEDGRALCLTDWDHDGDLDFWISNRSAPQLRFLRNSGTKGNHFVSLKLVGRKGNRDAIGARVEVAIPGWKIPLLKTVRAGDGYLAQSSRRLLFGLGEEGTEVQVTIRWPGGAVQTIERLAVDGHYLVSEGEEAKRWQRPAATLALGPRGIGPLPESAEVGIPMVTLLQVPAMSYASFDGKKRQMKNATGRALLVNLWASWCAPCVQELGEFKKRHADLKAAGIDVLALALDGVGEDSTDPAEASKLVASSKYPFATGRANEQILTLLERLHVRLTPMELEVVVPMSLLIDAEGRLAVLYKGAPEVDQIVADLQHSSLSRPERLASSVGLGGVSLEAEHAIVAKASDQLEVMQRFQFAQDMWQGGLLEAAEVQFRELMEMAPDFAEPANNLGLVYATKGEHSRAIASYRRALQIRGEFPLVHLNLGISLEAEGRMIEARKSYLRALEIDREVPKANDALGLLHAKKGELELARQYFQSETEVNPRFAEGHNHLGLICLSLKLPRDAIAPLKRATELDPTHADAFNNLGLAHKRLGAMKAAGEAFGAALEAQPNYLPAVLNQGVHQMEQGQLKKAETLFKQALTIQPNNGMAQRNLQRVRQLLGN